MALGEYPVVTLAQAREHHFAARKILAAGIDPMAERKAEAEAKQREVEARSVKLKTALRMSPANGGNGGLGKSQRHADYVLRRLEADVFPVVRSQIHRRCNGC